MDTTIKSASEVLDELSRDAKKDSVSFKIANEAVDILMTGYDHNSLDCILISRMVSQLIREVPMEKKWADFIVNMTSNLILGNLTMKMVDEDYKVSIAMKEKENGFHTSQ